MPVIAIKLEPSRLAQVIFAVLLLLAGLMIFELTVLWWIKLLITALTVYYAYFTWQMLTLVHANAVQSMQYLQHNAWLITTPTGQQQVQLQRDSYVAKYCMVLRFKTDAEQRVYCCLLMRDAIHADHYRALQVLLKYFDFNDQLDAVGHSDQWQRM